MNRSAELQLRPVRRAKDKLIAPGGSPRSNSTVHCPNAFAKAKEDFPLIRRQSMHP